MKGRCSRRHALKTMAAASGAALLPRSFLAQERPLRITDSDAEIQVRSVSAQTVHLTILPIQNGKTIPVPEDGSLVRTESSPPTTLRDLSQNKVIQAGDLTITIIPSPVEFVIANSTGQTIQKLRIDDSGNLSFTTGDGPLLGLGQGGPQFDRRGSIDTMRSGQGGYKLGTHGGRVPIPWLISTSGWAMFFHQPFGTFDFTGPESKFQPGNRESRLPLELFFVASQDPPTIMAEYCAITGYPEMPPLWSFGYQQSHRTLASREEVLSETRTFREKKLPCDAMIYLGTGFCPSGWNTENGSFTWN